MRTNVRMNGLPEDGQPGNNTIAARISSTLGQLTTNHSIEPLKQLFCSDLNYHHENAWLPRSWVDASNTHIVEDPLLLATGEGGFSIIYTRLKADQLIRDHERQVVRQLLNKKPEGLFVFSNKECSAWHFVNVKAGTGKHPKPVFRRITIEKEEEKRLRTAAERLAMLDLASMPDKSFMGIIERHEQAFDVEAVTNRFFNVYRDTFANVKKVIRGFPDQGDMHLFTQRLFNRLMFIAFIQRKKWLSINGQMEYLEALWRDYLDLKRVRKNFYVDRLSLLFFLGLNTPKFRDPLIGNVPFLNGGLFEKEKEDQHSGVVVPDECINSILHGLFDRFNFTVAESTPFDLEVAVDPEMLGQIFERLVTGRHETGSYYTPKAVVSFMCKEALKGYLHSQLPGESWDGISCLVDEHTPGGIGNHKAALDALHHVKVCDPACGSGAYLLDMMHELLELRKQLTGDDETDAHSVYKQKLEIIQNNLYGVDIDPFAVNIARLRLWLSLAVDFEGKTPEPLPNLNFKIEQGNSLTAPDPNVPRQQGFRHDLISRFREKKARYVGTHFLKEKEFLKEEIIALRQDIAEWTYGKGKASAIEGFDWAVEFAEIFADGGFDIAIANPPYVRQELIKDLKPAFKKSFPVVYNGKADLYCYFYARALQLLHEGGMLVFISSNKWFRANYGAILRKYIAETCWVRSITDFEDLPIFGSATAYPMIFVAQKEQASNQPTLYTEVKSLDPPYPDVLAIMQQSGQMLPPNALNGADWMLFDATSSTRLRKMKTAGIPLGEYVEGHIYYGIKTGFNAAFIIDGSKRQELIAQDSRSAEIIKPLVIGKDIGKWKVSLRDRWLIFAKRGIDIDCYPAIKAHLTSWRDYLESKNGGEESKGRAAGDYKWYELQASPADTQRFERPKIIFPDIALEPRFTFDTKGIYLNNTGYTIPIDDLYLLGVLNSSCVKDFYVEQSVQIRGGYLRFFIQYVERIPIPDASATDRRTIADLVQKCLDAQGVGCEQWEEEIDVYVAALYGL